MEKTFFEWREFSKEKENIHFPVDAIGDIFLLNVQKKTVKLSEKCAKLLMYKEERLKTEITQEELEFHLSEVGRHSFRQAIHRLVEGKVERAGCHALVKGSSGDMSSVIYLYRLSGCDELFGHISVDYEATREYEKYLEDTIQQLRVSQKINELIVEGASDYIFHFDLTTNVCTFSSKVLESLPLESPVLPDAMNRILSFIVHEDRQAVLDSFVPILTGQTDRHNAEFRILTKQGNIMWVSCHGKAMHDEEGRPIMLAGSLIDITKRKEEQEKIEHMLYYDGLTGLKNQRCFERDMIERLSPSDAKGSLLYMNIHKFRLYNELFGHVFGDKVLIDFANMLNLYFAGAYGIYRISGDEFCVSLPDTNRERIMAKLVPFQSVLKKTRMIEEHGVYINTYIAIGIYPRHGRTLEKLMHNLHQCLYQMLRAEKETVSFITKKAADNVPMQFWNENEMRKDIEQNFRNFRVVYQPIVHVDDRGSEWSGAEALLRYTNPLLPDLDQVEMIRTLEYSGLVLTVGRWILAQAIHECSKWNRNGSRKIVHVNVSAQQVSDVGLVEYICEKCKEENLPLSSLVIELTETSLLKELDVATNFCHKLLKNGIGVALDDFGTGYSSFNYLRNLPITQIKLDRSYVQQLAVDHYNQTFILLMHKLSQELGLELCVEGVETDEELNVLRKMQISKVQGYYFERPLEADIICREFLGEVIKE